MVNEYMEVLGLMTEAGCTQPACTSTGILIGQCLYITSEYKNEKTRLWPQGELHLIERQYDQSYNEITHTILTLQSYNEELEKDM